jgi:hypothetical protein
MLPQGVLLDHATLVPGQYQLLDCQRMDCEISFQLFMVLFGRNYSQSLLSVSDFSLIFVLAILLPLGHKATLPFALAQLVVRRELVKVYTQVRLRKLFSERGVREVLVRDMMH